MGTRNPDSKSTFPSSDIADLSHPVQALMSRTGSFPLRIALEVLQTYGRKGAVVLDPFCGKGTTMFAARLLGYSSLGLDIAPEAIACTKAKLADVSLETMERYLESLRFRRSSVSDVPAEVATFFHRDTLRDILGIRNRIAEDLREGRGYRRQAAQFCLGSLLGILHGHASYSLSIPSAHAYAMSPGYVFRYAKRHRLRAPRQDVKECLLTKIRRLLCKPLPPPVAHDVREGSVLECDQLFRHRAGEVDIILTSPPYLNAQTYAKDNWLRLWLLGHDYKQLKPSYIETGSVRKYEALMTQAFLRCEKLLKPNGVLICIAGDVRMPGSGTNGNGRAMLKTGDLLLSLCEQPSLPFTREHVDVQRVESTSRYYHALSKSNGHSTRGIIERLFVVRKV